MALLLAVTFAIPAQVRAQTGASPPSVERQKAAAAKQAQSLAKQGGSLAAQAQSVARQTGRALPSAPPAKPSEFYTVPWPEPLPQGVTPISWNCPPLADSQKDALLAESSRRTSLPRDLLRAVIQQESGFHPCAVSPAGAMGLMQLMPATAAELGVSDPFDPAQNILAGSRYLKDLIDRYSGSLPLALGAYNAGPSRVDRLGRVPQIPETQKYVANILSSVAAPATSEIRDSP